MDWFKRATQGLTPQKKKELPELWVKCPSCGEIIYKRELERNFNVCAHCNYHFRIKAMEYVRLLIDDRSFDEFNAHIAPTDFLKFRGKKKYNDQIRDAAKKAGANDALRSGRGNLNGRPIVLCVMDFNFIGGSMGSVVGEKISLAIDVAIAEKRSFLIVSASGGARMMEGALSLMQMAKTSAKLTLLNEARVPYISILTDPTTGGVTASYSMLGDINIAEPGALIGFAGPRVIKQTIGEDLPDGFQRAEFLLQHGFLDAIVPRAELKNEISKVLDILCADEQDDQEAVNGASSLTKVSAKHHPAAPELTDKQN